MKNPNTKAPKQVRDWYAKIGKAGGEGSDSATKSRAANVRWNKPGARKTISGKHAGE